MRVFITGYRHYELGIFKDSQPEVKVLRDLLRSKIIHLIEEGAEWFIIQGYTGIEMYAANEIIDLKEEYDIKLGVLKPFHKFDDRYSESDQINLNNTMTLGDNFNDVPMLDLAQIGIAMGNAPDEVKKHADVVTKSNNENGVSDAIKKYALKR